MKGLPALILIALPYLLFAQTELVDNFADGDFTINPAWSGSSNDFIVNTNKQLQLTAVNPSPSYLSVQTVMADSFYYELTVRMAFSPSSSNRVRIFLAADQQDLTGNLNGYFLQCGEDGGNDAFDLYLKQGSKETKIADGIDASVVATDNSVAFQISRSKKGDWVVMADIGLTGSFSNYLSVNDLTFSKSSFFGVVCFYTTTRADKFYFDDIKVGPLYKDVEPPKASLFQVKNADTVYVAFDEIVESTTALDRNNYLFEGVTVSSVWFDQGMQNRVGIQLPIGMQSGNQYSLKISGIRDLAGNTINPTDISVPFFKVAKGDVVINEFMVDPSPSQGLPDFEFIELFNTTNFDIDVSGWKIADATNTATISSGSIKANSYLILTSTSALSALQSYGDAVGVPSFPSLNNTAETISLSTDKGILMEKLVFDLSWYHDVTKQDGGFTLEKINPYTQCSGAANWKASQNSMGGTPGKQNSVFANVIDKDPPKLLGVKIVDSATVLLTFDEAIDSINSLTSTISVDGFGAFVLLQRNWPLYTEIVVHFAGTFEFNKPYTINISGLSDCEGNIMIPFKSTNLVYWKPVPVEFGDVVIHEIMADPEPSYGFPAAEFVELYNRSNKAVDTKDWVFSDQRDSCVFPTYVLPPNSYLIICTSTQYNNFIGYGQTLGLSGFPGINNGGETLVLKTKHGKIIHTVSFSDSWYRSDDAKSGGFSLEMIDPENNFCGEGDNWKAAQSGVYATPGQANSVHASNPDLQNPRVHSVFTNGNRVELLVGEMLDSASVFSAGYSMDHGITLSNPIVYNPLRKVVSLDLSSTLQNNQAYVFKVEKLKDCLQNEMSNTEFVIALPEKADSFDWVVNEVLFNPASGGFDFVELYNRSEKYLNLAEISIGNRGDDGELSSVYKASAENQIIGPHQYVALCEDVDWLAKNYTVKYPERVVQSANLPSFPDSDGEVVILGKDSILIDEFDYSSSFHFSLLNDKEGVSLEKINPDLPTNNSAHWHSASAASGYATPGYENSQLLAEFTKNDVLSLSSKRLSPDEDGYEDYVEISVLGQNDNAMATVRIFDLSGNQVIVLIENGVLGTENVIKWDGTNALGNKAQTGIYIIMAEVVSLSGKVSMYRESIAVVSKI